MERQYWLMNPGPVNTSEAVKRAALRPDLCHREPEYGQLMAGVRSKLLRAAQVEGRGYKSVLIAGSGTAALELGVSSIVSPGRKLLVTINGVYGERIDRMAEVHGIPRERVIGDWRARVDLGRVEQALLADPGIEVVSMIHHETTTGLLNPVRELGALCQKHGKLFFLDSISAFAGEELELAGWGVDFMACTANKCLHGLPGVAFLLLSARGEAHLEQVAPRSVYFDLKSYIRTQDQGTIPFTPCIPGMYTLDAALDELLAEGTAKRIATYRARATLIRQRLGALGLELYLAPELLSNTITAFKLPPGVSYERLHDALKADGFVIYAGQGKLAQEIFRVANMGHVPLEIYEELARSVARALGARG